MATTHRVVVVLVVLAVILVPVFSQRTEKQPSAWEALLARDPGAADDPSLGWRERLSLHALTPEQKEAWSRGATEESLLLQNGQTLRAYLEERLSAPAGVYVALPVPCGLFASEGIEAGIRYGIQARGEDLSIQGGSAAGCGIPAEATALILQLRLEGRQPGRLKLWAGDGPEPAQGVIQTEDWNVPVRQGTAVVTLAAQGAPEADLVLRATAPSEVSGEVVGYFRALTPGDQPGGRILLYTEGSSTNSFGTGAGTSGSYNSFFGGSAGNANSGNWNSFFGWTAGRFNTTGFSNNFFGAEAGYSNTTGYRNSFFGGATGKDNSEGHSNSFYGFSAGRFNTTGSLNAFFGHSAGYSNESGEQNSFFGTEAGYNSTTTGNSFFGYHAGRANTNSSGNSFFGREAGRVSTASFNSFFGHRAGYSNTSGSANAFFGWGAGFSNNAGGANSFVGDFAGYYNTTGNGNVSFGKSAGVNNSTGSFNSFIGRSAGTSNTVEDNNSFIGAYSNGAAGITNATALGYRAPVSQSNSLVLGSVAGLNDATASVNVGIGTPAPERQLHLKGNNAVFRMDRDTDTAAFMLVRTNAAGNPLKTFVVGTNAFAPGNGEFVVNDLGAAVGGAGSRRMTITNTGAVQFTGSVSAAGFINTSSLAYKTNVRTLDHALETVNRLRGVRFDWKESGEPAVGLIAEEVAEVVPELVALEDGAPSGVSYANLVAVLVEATKEQQRTIEAQQLAIESLIAELGRVKALLVTWSSLLQ